MTSYGELGSLEGKEVGKKLGRPSKGILIRLSDNKVTQVTPTCPEPVEGYVAAGV